MRPPFTFEWRDWGDVIGTRHEIGLKTVTDSATDIVPLSYTKRHENWHSHSHTPPCPCRGDRSLSSRRQFHVMNLPHSAAVTY